MLPNWLYGKSKSKLANILGGGGGTPADYNQVKAQVNQNTQDITGLLDNLEVNGAVNMLSNIAASQTINSVEWTVNSDGTVQAYVPSGITTSAESNLIIATPDKMNALLSEYGELKIVGCPAGGSNGPGGYGIRCKQESKYPRDNGDGLILKSSDGTVRIGLSCNIRENTTGPKTLLFKPMIGLVSTPNFDYAHYVPYAKSNRELTEENNIETGLLTGDVTFNANNIIKKNGIVTISAAFVADKDYAGFTEFVNVPSGFRPINTYSMGILFNDSHGTCVPVTGFAAGKIQASGAITSGENYRIVMTYIIA